MNENLVILGLCAAGLALYVYSQRKKETETELEIAEIQLIESKLPLPEDFSTEDVDLRKLKAEEIYFATLYTPVTKYE